MLNPNLCIKQRIWADVDTVYTVAVFPTKRFLVINVWQDYKLKSTHKFSTACKMSDRPRLLELAEIAEIDPVNDIIGKLLTLFV